MAEQAHHATGSRPTGVRPLRVRPPPADVAMAVAAVSVVVLAIAEGADRSVSVVYAIGVALPLGIGLGRPSARPEDRFARLLLGTGVLWALTALAHSDDSALYSLGRLA